MGFGDEILATGEVKRAQARDPRPVVILDRFGMPRRHALFDHNPRIAYARGPGNQEIINGSSRRPYIAGKTDQRWTWKPYRPEPGEIYFTKEEKRLGAKDSGYVLLEPHAKQRDGNNKEWSWRRWEQLSQLIKDLPLAQMGPVGTQILPGVKHIVTESFRLACAVLCKAQLVATHEGGIHHAAAALNVPAVVIFGGFISPNVTGYDGQTNFFIGTDLGCGSRLPCQHCREAMAKITPGAVAEAMRAALNA